MFSLFIWVFLIIGRLKFLTPSCTESFEVILNLIGFMFFCKLFLHRVPESKLNYASHCVICASYEQGWNWRLFLYIIHTTTSKKLSKVDMSKVFVWSGYQSNKIQSPVAVRIKDACASLYHYYSDIILLLLLSQVNNGALH